jgi:hypothetical protein
MTNWISVKERLPDSNQVRQGESMKLPGRNTLKRRLGPGCWEDMDGNIHFSIPDILAAMKLEDTPENREIAQKFMKSHIEQESPSTKVIVREKPE